MVSEGRLAINIRCRSHQRARSDLTDGFKRCSRSSRWIWGARWAKKNDIGRSQKGFSSKIHFVVNSRGKPVQAILSPGQVHDSTVALKLIKKLRTKVVIADKAYDSNAIVSALKRKRIQAVIPCRTSRLKPRPCDGRIYRRRIVVEKSFHKLKRFRALASRYAKTSIAFLSLVQIASVKIWGL